MSDGTLTGSETPIVPIELATPDLFGDASTASLPRVARALLEQIGPNLDARSATMVRIGHGADPTDAPIVATWPDASDGPAGTLEGNDPIGVAGDGIGCWSDAAGRHCVAFEFELSDGGRLRAVFDTSDDPFAEVPRAEIAAQLRAAAPLLACADRIDELARPTEHADADRADVPFVGEVTYYQNMVSRSPRMVELFEQIDRVKDNKLSTIVTGETGTGKELVARAIHFAGNRASAPFEVVACGSIASSLLESELFGHKKGAFSGAENDHAGAFERASGGTIFLDEIADMTMEMQQKILRVLQEERVRPVGGAEPIDIDVRIISSSRHDLMELVRSGQFREDLYYRLNVMTLEVPPLRDRREDIPLLIDHFLSHLNEEEDTQKRLADATLRELIQYSWPGNVQELRNVLTRAVFSTSGRVVTKKTVVPLLNPEVSANFVSEDLYQDGERLHLRIPLQQGFNDIIAECEKLVIIHALRANRGNKSRVTQHLGIPRQTLYNKLDKYGITEADYAPPE